MSFRRCCLLLAIAGLSACTPLTYIEETVEQNPIPARSLQHVLLIAPASQDSVRRSYENRCDSELTAYAKVTSSHEIWPELTSLNRVNVEGWLKDHADVDGILVVQLAALEQSRSNLPQGGVATRELQLMTQPGLTWNYQPDPAVALPEHPTVLTQSSLYLMPEGKLALTMMARTNVDGKMTSLFRSHCDSMITELQGLGWLTP